MVRGVCIEGYADERGGFVLPRVLCIEDRARFERTAGLTATDILNELLSGSETGGDLVTMRVDYLVAMIALGANDAVARALWSGARVSVGPYTVNYVPALNVWIKSDDRTICVHDLQRWLPPDPDETAALFTRGRNAVTTTERWLWTGESHDVVVNHAAAAAAWTGEVARAIDDACGRAGLPRYWRTGPGRVAGAMLDRMATKADISPAPLLLKRAIQTAYVGGRISLFQTGHYDEITQVDVNSAYPWAMTALPSLDGATWRRKRSYDRAEPFGLWQVSWNVPDGAVSGPFPVRTGQNAIVYPLAGSGWYWAPEVAAALECYGSDLITVADGCAVRPRDERKPFAGLMDYYADRRELKDRKELAAAYVLKLGMTACYGRIAQVIQHDGKPGRWGNLALAGLTTATVRARMMTTLWEHETTAIALATDSLTIAGHIDISASRDLGEWSVTTGGDALMLPSGVFSVRTGQATMERVSGVERARAMTIDWDSIYEGWAMVGLALSYKVAIPVFCGLGVSGASDQWGRFGRWRLQRHELIGNPHGSQPKRSGPRTWRLMPVVGKPIRAAMYVPRAGTVGRLDDQSNRTVPNVAREHDQPFT